MFYCDPCGDARSWPTDEITHLMGESYGPCEICGKDAVCCDVSSKDLPIPRSIDNHQPREAKL